VQGAEPKEVLFEMRKPSDASSQAESQSQEGGSDSSALIHRISSGAVPILMSIWTLLYFS